LDDPSVFCFGKKEGHTVAKNMEIIWLYDFYGEMLTEKQQQMIELYYEEDLSLSEIAENQHITRQGVRDCIKRAEAQMVEMEDRLHLAARFRVMHDGLDAIREAAQDIQMLNDRTRFSRDIEERAAAIVKLTETLRER
jgi:predicted DNA-binding protein YlxM (UPF0122 family)